MTSFNRTPLERRTVLRGLGACLSLPLLEAMFPSSLRAAPSQYRPLAQSLARHPRAIFCYVPNGVNILDWMPKGTGSDFELSPTLEVLAAHRQDLSIVTGLGHPNSRGGHSGADTWLTGANLTAVPGKQYANTISADQIIAEKHGAQTRFPSLQLSDGSGTGSAGHSHTLSFDRKGTPLPAENSPQRLFERLFVPDGDDSKAATLRRYAEKKSILDSIASDAKALDSKLGTADKAKLEEYFTSVRETERRVARMESWIDVPKPAVESQHLQLNSQPGNGHDRPMWIDVMLELSYLSFVTDTTRVITFEWSREAGGFGGGGENHHELSHHGGDPGMLNSLAKIDRFHLERLGRFLSFLKETEEADSQMLDSTMVMFGSGMNSGEGGAHSPKNLPLLLAGGKSLGLKHGQHLAHDQEDHPPLSNVLTTMIQKMDVESDTFQDATGPLDGLV
ncbi:MAG: DUF1552 domain-containing protein [Akkermansiaceae bacterium]|jgi:hypothetical protein